MAYRLKLNIYYFELRKIKNSTTLSTSRKMTITEDSTCMLNDFVTSLQIQGTNDENYTQTFLKDFTANFNSSFIPNKKNTQAMSVIYDSFNNFSSREHTIWGKFKGGSTDIELEVYKNIDAEQPTSNIVKENVTSTDYFFKIWIPKDSNIGVLMVQSYTNMGCAILFRDQLHQYFVSKGYKPFWCKCVPKEYIQKYLNDGAINEIQVVHAQKKQSIEMFDPIFKPFTYATKKSIYNHFSLRFVDIFCKPNIQKILKSQIKAFDVNYNEKQDEVILFYKDSKGRKTHAKLADMENILPIIILDDSLKNPESHVPIWDELHKHTTEILNQIKIDISYTPKSV